MGNRESVIFLPITQYPLPIILTSHKPSLPQIFKGIALFTPAGDLIYCIDPSKQHRWHLHLCLTLQEILDLPEPPHFLVPCYTATIDYWLDPRTQQIKAFAEAYPAVMRHQNVLNAIFDTDDLVWEQSPWPEGLCDRMVLTTYRSSFPQLWQDHDLIVRLEPDVPVTFYQKPIAQEVQLKTQGYILRLFVAGHIPGSERILKNLHQLLEQHLSQPYTLKVIDVVTHPELAEINQVSATPTLMRVSPHPIRRIVGDLDNVEKILQMLIA